MKTPRLLVFVGTEGVCHDHAGQGQFLTDWLARTGEIEAELSRDYEIFKDGLPRYDATLFFTDIGTLTDAQESGLLDFIRQGGGFFGLHTAAASFRDRAGYHDMLNAFFNGHSKYMDFTVQIVDRDHPITRGLSDFCVTDELYYLRHDPSRSHHLMQAFDPTTDSTHVMALTHHYGDGCVFYFALGHDMAVLENPVFQEVVRRGSLWVARRSPEP